MTIRELLNSEIKVINLGLEDFATNLEEKGTAVVHVRWQPPAGGDEELLKLLDKLK